MQIEPGAGSNLPPLAPALPVKGERSVADASKGITEGTVFLPTAALTGLLTRLQGIPDVRDDVVRQLREQLAKGDLLTPASIAETAQAILGAESMGD